MERLLNEYQVRDSVISGLPVFADGIRVGTRDAYDGDTLTDADLAGVDVERLLKLGSIALVNEPSVPSPLGHAAEMTEPTEREVLEAMTKATLAGIAQVAGIETKGLNKTPIVDAILEARAQSDVEAESQEADAEADIPMAEQLATKTDEELGELATAAGIETKGVAREDIIQSLLDSWDAAAQESAAEAQGSGDSDIT